MDDAPKRRWYQFSLRTLFVVVTISACLAAYVNNALKSPLQGRWTLTRMERGRNRVDDSFELVFDGDRVSFISQRGPFNYTFEFDAKQNPPTIDCFGEVNGGRVLALLGIYSLEGDGLKIQFALPEDVVDDVYRRPKEFSHGELDGVTYWLRRANSKRK